MGDLAQAIVDLGRTSEQRRNARRSLREATAVVITAMLRHLRVGDHAAFTTKDDDFLGPYFYRVERVGWPLMDMRRRDPDGVLLDYPDADDSFDHPKGAATLVRYDDTVHLHKQETIRGAVLLDVRTEHVDDDGITHPVDGRAVWRIDPSDEEWSPQTDLYLATDTDLMRFANDAATIVERMNRDFSSEAKRFGDAAEAIARLAPR